MFSKAVSFKVNNTWNCELEITLLRYKNADSIQLKVFVDGKIDEAQNLTLVIEREENTGRNGENACHS